MRITHLAAAALGCTAAYSVIAADVHLARLTTTAGVTYTNVIVTATEPVGVHIRHRFGAATLAWSEIPEELRPTLGYRASSTPAPTSSVASTQIPFEAARKHSAQFIFPIIGAHEKDVLDKFQLYPRTEVYDCPSGLSCFAVDTEGPSLEFRFLDGVCAYYRLTNIKETDDAFAILKKYGGGMEWQKISEQEGGDLLSWGYHTTSIFRRPDTGLLATLHMGIPHHHSSDTTLDVTFEAPAYTAYLRRLKDTHDKARDRAAEERTKDL